MTDDLLNALTGAPPKDKRLRCYFTGWFETQTPERQEAISQAMKNDKWTTASLYELFQQYGYEKQYNTLRSHRVRDCSCAND